MACYRHGTVNPVIDTATTNRPGDRPPITLACLEPNAGHIVVIMVGRLDVRTAALVRSLERRSRPPATTLAIDMGAVPFADQAGLAALVALSRYATRHGVGFRLFGCTPTVTDTLHRTGLDRVLKIAPGESFGGYSPRRRRLATR